MVWRDLKDVCVNKANGIYYDCINRYEDNQYEENH